MKVTYTPQADSLPSQVIGYFTNHPDEALLLDDIVDKFGCGRSNIHTKLVLAVDAKMLLRDRNEDGEYVYKAGANLPKTVLAPAPAPAPAPAKRKGKADGADIDAVLRKPAPVFTLLPKPDDVVIEDGVPITSRVGPGSKIDWTPLFKRLKTSQSFKLPLAAKATITKTMTEFHKTGKGRFTIRTFKDTRELRVWRLS